MSEQICQEVPGGGEAHGDRAAELPAPQGGFMRQYLHVQIYTSILRVDCVHEEHNSECRCPLWVIHTHAPPSQAVPTYAPWTL